MSLYTFAVALIFLIKLRLGQDFNLINYVDRRYGEDTKKLLRRYEGSKNKFSKCRLDLSFLIENIFHNFKSSKVFSSVIRSGDIKCLKELASDGKIIVSRPNKGRGVVILDRVTNKMLNIIADRDKFQLLPDAIDVYTRKIEDKVNNFLREMKDTFTADYKTLLATGSAPGILYGLPKIHSHNFNTKFQLRPIFAAYNNPCFKIAKFLVPHLSFLTTS